MNHELAQALCNHYAAITPESTRRNVEHFERWLDTVISTPNVNPKTLALGVHDVVLRAKVVSYVLSERAKQRQTRLTTAT